MAGISFKRPASLITTSPTSVPVPTGSPNNNEDLYLGHVNIPTEFVLYHNGDPVETDTAIAQTIVDNTTREIKVIVNTKQDSSEYTGVSGYYDAETDTFFKEKEKINPLPRKNNKIYIDLFTGNFYLFDEVKNKFWACYSTGTETQSGLTKLYETLGEHVDGAITQKETSDQIQAIKFAIDPTDTECLVLNKK